MKKIIIYLLILFNFIAPIPTTSALSYNYKNITITSDVMSDLQSFSFFDENNYQHIDYDRQKLYGLDFQLITIAETTDHKLVGYVDVPFKYNDIKLYLKTYCDYLITSINIATKSDLSDFNNYDINIINTNNYFIKFEILNFNVSPETNRNYYISSIYSKFDNKFNYYANSEIAYNVSTSLNFKNKSNGLIEIDKNGIETILITDKYCGFVRYKNNTAPDWIDKSSCDVHFVAFNTDKKIDKLFECDILYYSQYVETIYYPFNSNTNYGDKNNHLKTLNCNEIQSNNGSNFLFFHANKYTWNEIQTVSEFINSVTKSNIYNFAGFSTNTDVQITDDGYSNLQNKKFILNYHVSNYDDYTPTYGTESGYQTETKTICGDITILRLKFMSDGITYNLGVIDNKSPEDTKPINVNTTNYGFDVFEFLKYLLILIWNFIKNMFIKYWYIIIPLLIILFYPIWRNIFSIIKLIFNFIIKIIKIPFKLFKKGGKRK